MTEQNGVERSTATETFRAMLDERGVKWWQSANTLGCIFTRWYSPIFGDEVVAMENGEEGLVLFDHYLTPEQAIAATLGRGTCHITRQFTCSECGHQYPTRNYECYETCDGRTAYASLGYDVLDCEKPNYCPSCGCRIIVEPTTNDVDAEVGA